MTQYVIKDEVCFRAVEKPGFVALVNEFELRFQMPNRKKVAVPMDVKIGWNSTYKMLDIALKYRIVFERMVEECVPFIKYFRENDEKGRAKMLPSAEDWDNAKAFVHFLKNLYDLTLQLSASKTPTSHLISLSMFALQIEIEKKCTDSDLTLSKVAKAKKLKFDKYWGDWSTVNPLIFIANVLDPRNKLQMLKVSVKKLKVGGLTNVYQVQQVQHLCDRFKDDLVSLWAEYKGVNDTVLNQTPLLECEDVGDSSNKGDLHLFDELYDGVQEEIEQDRLNQISNEVDKYLADEMEKRSNPNFDLLEWWKLNASRYSILSLIAKDIFAIPSSTVASESAFSLGKRAVDPFRTCLSPKMVEALVCTNDWLRVENFSLYKDPTDDDLEFYREIEEIEKSMLLYSLV
ncbi:hypothetical protein SASPL_148434 [Salvia splendens]|uniref:HAT C-terminal dimerisation domain-containing protein n=1 Tax=Salvia splendens TaxID=180675 RepID=A0A8X8W9U8_SALSN|nr:hypothetical protein SASPL_148434 [Salvia splendens]